MSRSELTCRARSALDEPIAGTAAEVARWLCFEVPGGWGKDVFDGIALGLDLAAELKQRTSAAGVRLMFIRKPGRAEIPVTRPTVLLASSDPADSWCESLTVSNPRELLDIDLSLMSGPRPGIGSPVAEPVTLVCTHAKRDQCCAVLGRPTATFLAANLEAVWECSHTGGHRFAPSIVVLPTGYTYGRISASSMLDAVHALRAGRVQLDGLRGRSFFSESGQVAELAVRAMTDCAPGDLRVSTDGSSATVEHVDGRQWQAEVASTKLDPRPASCGAEPKPVRSYRVESIRCI